MGYEICFSYHEKNEDGKIDTEKTSTFTKIVGKRNEDVPLERVAAITLSQFARRDVYISDVKIMEYVKREISFKETKTGIIIKNKKFNFDQIGSELKAEDNLPELRNSTEVNEFDLFKPSLSTENQVKVPEFNSYLMQQASQKKPVRDPNIPIRHEVFRPSNEDFTILQRQGTKLTMNKPYALFGEVVKNGMEPVYYVVQDDTGNRINISSIYFEPMRKGLVGMENGEPQVQMEGKLSYVNYGQGGSEMPQLRRNF